MTAGMIPDAELTVTRSDSALWYTSLGWKVFPCLPGSKVPATSHGFLDATCDVDRIRRFWDRNPRHNIGIATGAPGPDVLDVDDHGPAGSGWNSFGKLKAAGLLGGCMMLARTPRRGIHVFYAGTAQTCKSLPAHHLDMKATGGYVVASPSFVQNEDYEGWYDIIQLAAELDPPGEQATLDWASVKAVLSPPVTLAPKSYSGTADSSALAAWMASQPEGNRNHALFWASCRAAAEGGDLDALVEAAVTAGLPETEARRTVDSAAGRNQ